MQPMLNGMVVFISVVIEQATPMFVLPGSKITPGKGGVISVEGS
jgi:hypothetical protein